MTKTAAPEPSKKSKETKPEAEAKSDKTAPQEPRLHLQCRYYWKMKPQRVFPLTVELPKKKEPPKIEGGVVVVRASIPGAEVTPQEQRLDVTQAGNKVHFYVTPLARGRLPDAHLEVFVPGQPRLDVKLGMRASGQKLAGTLLLLALLVPWLIGQYTVGPWRPTGRVTYSIRDAINPNIERRIEREGRPEEVVGKNVKEFFEKDIGKKPLLNEKWSDGPEFLSDFVLSESASKWASSTYEWTLLAVRDFRLRTILFIFLLLLSFVAWSFGRPRRTLVRKSIPLKQSETPPPSEVLTAQPVA